MNFFSAALLGPVLFHPEGSSAGSLPAPFLELPVRLGRCCAELHYGTVLMDAIASFIGYSKGTQETGSKFVPPKQSHSAIRPITEPVLSAISKLQTKK